MRRLLLLMVLSSAVVAGAAPRWFVCGRSDPAMFIGSGAAKVENGKSGEALTMARQAAVHDACVSVSCSVQGRTSLMEREADSSGGESLFVSESSIRTAVEAVNVKLLEQAVEKGTAYVMVGLPKDDLRNLYRMRVERGLNDGRKDFTLGEKLSEKDPHKAMQAYERSLRGAMELAHDLKIYVFLNNWQNDMAEAVKAMAPCQEIERRLAALAGSTPRQPRELATELLRQVLPKGKSAGAFYIYPLEYENTGYVSVFGQLVTALLENGIIRESGWQRANEPQKADYLVRGRLLKAGKGLSVVLELKGRGISRSGQIYLSQVTCENIGWDQIQPRDIERALRDKVALLQGLKRDTGLRVELQTDRMTDGPVVYCYGERPKLVLKVNRACYVRLIYIFSDGTRILLLNNYPIKDDMANEWQPLPVNWEVCEPPGVEQMLVQASTDHTMPPLNVKRRKLPDGYYQDIITDGVQQAVAATRGAKIFAEKGGLTEMPYQWTIFEKKVTVARCAQP